MTIMTREFPPNIYGGAGVHVDYLSACLAELMPVEVRCFDRREGPQGPFPVTGFEPWLEMARGSDPKLRKVLDPLSVDLAMVKQPISSDVIHCHTWYTFFAGYLGKMLYGTKLVTTIHSMEPLRPWKAEQLGRGYQVSSWMERVGIENSDQIIAVSQGMREDVIEHFNVDPRRVAVIHNGIDLAGYRRVDDSAVLDMYNIRRPYVLFVGRVSRQKGILNLLDAVGSLNPGVTIVMCAGSPDTPEVEQEVASRVSQMDNVVWINKMLPKEQVISLYSNAAVFACPSVYEPFGIINLEAMACETPVVASKVGGIPEVVVHEHTGLLVEPGDPQALAEAINTILDAPEMARRMGRAGRTRVEQHFSWDAIARQTKQLYESVVSE